MCSQFVSVRKHSTMGCAVVSFASASTRAAVLREVGAEASVGGVRVQVQAQTDKQTKQEVPTDIFVAWGRQIEKATPLAEDVLLAFFVDARLAAQAELDGEQPHEDGEGVDHSGTTTSTGPDVPAEEEMAPEKAAAGLEAWPGAAPSHVGGGGGAATAEETTAAAPPVPTKDMVAVRGYQAEAEGYLTVVLGDVLRVRVDVEEPGDRASAYEVYVFAEHKQREGAVGGWVPKEVVWERYADAQGAPWLHDPSTGVWKWEHLLFL